MRSSVLSSVFVVYFFCKTHDIFQFQNLSVIQHGPAAHAAEDLMLLGAEDLEVQVCRPIQYGDKVHLNPPSEEEKVHGLQ